MEILNNLQKKTTQPLATMFYLGILSGLFLTIGAILFGVITSFDNSSLVKLAGSAAFSVGLILVIFRKTQLFTGNNLMILSLIKKHLNIKSVLKNWVIVYLGNFIGSIIGAIAISFIFQSHPSIIERFIGIAQLKVSYQTSELFLKAIMCNYLVCLAVYLGLALKPTFARVLGIILPITLFVYLGFEHSIANMIFIPAGLTQTGFSIQKLYLFLGNLIPVTLGNIVGGAILCLSLLVFLKEKRPRV